MLGPSFSPPTASLSGYRTVLQLAQNSTAWWDRLVMLCANAVTVLVNSLNPVLPGKPPSVTGAL